jgi:hypothetical protein
VKSLVDLLEHLLHDCGRRSGAPVARDVKTLRQRVKHEGDSFITITLPNFCRDFERSLDEERIAPGSFLSFRKTRSGIPAFLQGFLRNVFDQEGVLLAEPSTDCILSIRQICLFGKKIQRPCSNARNSAAVDGYAKCDDDVVDLEEGQFLRYFRYVASHVMASIELSQEEFLSEFVPKHGPGATQDRLISNKKWTFPTWHQRLSDCGLTPTFAIGVSYAGSEDESGPDIVQPGAEKPVRVVLVPKTQKTPRVIAVEPSCMQFVQQGLLGYLVPRIENARLTGGHVNFRDQSINQGLALDASKYRHLATLDMSEASDRVSCAHVEELLRSVPWFKELVFASRSRGAKLPGGQKIDLKKFASMGSALCFPMEALVFYTSIIASRILRAGLFPTAQLVHEFGQDVYVYGDDLIVPTGEAPAICQDLEDFGFKVNRHKSFWTGRFRESCGSDCYAGELVTPVYLRHDLPTDRRDAAKVVSCIETCNQLAHAGYTSTAIALRETVERLLGPLPTIQPLSYSKEVFVNGEWVRNPQGSPALGWTWSLGQDPPRRWDANLQQFFHRCWVAVSSKCDDILDGYAALAKCIRIIGVKSKDPMHLATSPRPYSLTLKRRWLPVS